MGVIATAAVVAFSLVVCCLAFHNGACNSFDLGECIGPWLCCTCLCPGGCCRSTARRRGRGALGGGTGAPLIGGGAGGAAVAADYMAVPGVRYDVKGSYPDAPRRDYV